ATDAGTESARAGLRLALGTLLGLFAPFLPYATEEVWSWWKQGSVHRSSWPRADSLLAAANGGTGPGPAGPGAAADPALLDLAGVVLGRLRKAKSEAKRSMRAGLDLVVISCPAEQAALIEAARSDICDAGAVKELRIETGNELSIEAVLEPESTAPPQP
ncbi:MAG: class I tRNA ligase family protein, partial [Acidimicrobiales bacterium]